jgi:hypothetical protein
VCRRLRGSYFGIRRSPVNSFLWTILIPVVAHAAVRSSAQICISALWANVSVHLRRLIVGLTYEVRDCSRGRSSRRQRPRSLEKASFVPGVTDLSPEKYEINDRKRCHHETKAPHQHVADGRTTLRSPRLDCCLNDSAFFLF